jgi:aryl-alcohol dehydrogenase-like predicted oxidoreductase
MTSTSDNDETTVVPNGRGRVGLGAMPLSTSGRPQRSDAIATLHAAFDAGVRMVDTADAYCLAAADTGHNELLVAEAIAAWTGPRSEIVVATKGGHVRDADGGWHTDGRPEHIVRAAAASRQRLGVGTIALYYFHRPDPMVPFVRSVEAMAALLDDGTIGSVGLSNVNVEQLEVAMGMVPVSAVQNSFSPYDGSSRDVMAWCEANGLQFVAWAPLGGQGRAATLGSDVETQLHGRLASAHGVSVAQMVLAWILARSPAASVIPGARRARSIIDAVAAESVVLSADEIDQLNEHVDRSTRT